MNNSWIALLSIGIPSLITMIIYFLEKNTKRISYEILQNSLIISEKNKLDNIEITYKNAVVNNIAIVEIAFINNGNRSISKSDYEEGGIIINFPYNHILSGEIDLCDPNDVKPDIVANTKSIAIKPLLLNTNDLFVIRLLLKETYLSKFNIEGRIKDVKSIVNYSENKMGNNIKVVGLVISGLGILGVITSGYHKFLNIDPYILLYIFFSMTFFGVILNIYGEILKFKLSRKINKLRKKQTSIKLTPKLTP